MADYNVNMKQWNGTSFDNVLPLAYNAKQLEGKTWGDALTIDVITERTKVISPIGMDVNMTTSGVDGSKYSNILILLSFARPGNQAQSVNIKVNDVSIGYFNLFLNLEMGAASYFMLSRGYKYSDFTQNGVLLAPISLGYTTTQVENTAKFDEINKISLYTSYPDTFNVFEYEILGIK